MSNNSHLISGSGRSVRDIRDILASSSDVIVEACEKLDDRNPYTDSDKMKVASIAATKFVYGIKWDSVNDIMIKGILVNGIFVPTEYDTYPIQEQMVRGLLTTDGTFTPLYPTDSSKLEDGSTAILDGSMGQVMVQIPRFYMLTTVVGSYKYLLISEASFEFNSTTAWVPPIFGDDDYRYIGAFKGVADTDSTSAVVKSIVKDTSGYSSNPYPNPFTNRTRDQFRTQQQDGFFSYCWGLYEVVWTMYLTEYADWDTQSTIPGYTGLVLSWSYAYLRPSGRTLSLGNSSGSILIDLAGVDSDLVGAVATDKYVANSYRGIENFYGSVWEFIDGINIDNTDGSCHVYVSHTPANFADDTDVNYIDTGHVPNFGSDDSWITDMCWLGEDLNFYPSSITGGSSSTYIGDYHYNASGGWRTVRCGGYLAHSIYAGFGCISASFNSSNTLAHFNVRTAY